MLVGSAENCETSGAAGLVTGAATGAGAGGGGGGGATTFFLHPAANNIRERPNRATVFFRELSMNITLLRLRYFSPGIRPGYFPHMGRVLLPSVVNFLNSVPFASIE